MVAEVGGHLGREDRTELMLLFPMVLGIIPVPGLGRDRGRTGGYRQGWCVEQQKEGVNWAATFIWLPASFLS